MKIFLSFLQSAQQHPIPAYSFWEFYIKNGINETNHSWIECENVDWAEGLVPQSKEQLAHWKANAWEKTLAKIKIDRPELFLSYLYPQQIDEQAITEIKKLGIYCVNFFCDHIREYTKTPSQFGVFDLNWVPEHKALAFYGKKNYPFIHLPMPMWVEPIYRKMASKETSQVSFIGSHDQQRQRLFEKLVKNSNIPFEIYGAGWLKDENQHGEIINNYYGMANKLSFQIRFLNNYGLKAYFRKMKQRNITSSINEILSAHLNGKLSFIDYINTTKESMITLGVNRYPDFRFPVNKPNTYSRLRDIEAPMLGACYLTEWTEGLDQLYDIGNEIEIYRNVDELVEKIKELECEPLKRKILRANGQKRSLQDHSIMHSLDKIFKRASIIH